MNTLTIEDIIERIRGNQHGLGIMLYGPASMEELDKFEKSSGITLPDDLLKFYNFSDGFESNEDMFRIIPLDEIAGNIKDRNINAFSPTDFHIAEYMTYCDMWTISINPADKNDYKIYNKAATVITLTDSFSTFLDTFLTGGVFDGLYSWREKLENGQ
jgi:hypothetical protein